MDESENRSLMRCLNCWRPLTMPLRWTDSSKHTAKNIGAWNWFDTTTTSKNGTPAIWECECDASVIRDWSCNCFFFFFVFFVFFVFFQREYWWGRIRTWRNPCSIVIFLFLIFFYDCSEECLKKKCEYYLNVDSVAHMDNPHLLKLMIEQNRPVLAPMIIRPYQAWSNFWGSLTSDGFYARSIDYMEIVQNTKRSVVSEDALVHLLQCILFFAILFFFSLLLFLFDHCLIR